MKNIKLVKPTATLGMAVNHLVAACSPLDMNSIYCNLLQTDHFRETSVAALMEKELVGFVSGYFIPNRLDTLFVWQVAVGERTRGDGLAKNMLMSLLERSVCKDVCYLETTITKSNKGSWALFRRLAQQLNTCLEESVLYDKTTHFQGEHDTEYLVRIGPF